MRPVERADRTGPPAMAGRGPGAARTWAAAVALGALVALVAMAFLLATYRLHIVETPLGWDTPKYLWRTALAAEVGVSGLPERVPPPVNASPDRPGFPVVALSIRGVSGVAALDLAALLPAVMAAATGLAGAAFAVAGLGRRPWEGALMGLALGTSSLVVRLAGPEGYQDNLLAAAVIVAALVPVVRVARGRGGAADAVAGGLLLAAAAALHWASYGMFLVVLGLTLAWRWRGFSGRRPSGQPLRRTPQGRLLALAGGSLLAGAAVYAVLGTVPDPPVIHAGEFSKKLADTVDRLDLVLLPLALVGLLAERRRPGLPGRPGERFAVDLLSVWLALVLAAVLLQVAGVPVPAHRALAFAIPLPILAVLGALALGRAVAGRLPGALAGEGRAGSLAVGAVAVVLLGIGAYQAQATWLGVRPAFEVRKAQDGAAVAAYLDAAGVPADRPVVVVVHDRGPNPDFVVPLMAHTLRTQLPPERIAHTYLYVGDPETFLERRPDVERSEGSELIDGVSWRFFRDVRPLYDRDPIAVVTQAYNLTHYGRWESRHPGSVVAPNVAVVSGPVLASPLTAVPGGPGGRIDGVRLSATAVAVLALLAAAGAGWALALGRRLDPFAALALAPALGVAGVTLLGLVVDAAGLRLGGAAGAAVVPAVAVSGAAAAWIAHRRGASGGQA
ncbi:MAG: hypothetical protein HY658_03055 [Actinobacteria bacterium]|nr:hypothetical protein [Actinomycetota bacterium]